jgi:hypothetical protein
VGSDLPTVQTSSKIMFRRGLKTVKTGTQMVRNLIVRGSTIQILHIWVLVFTVLRKQLNSFLLKLVPRCVKSEPLTRETVRTGILRRKIGSIDPRWNRSFELVCTVGRSVWDGAARKSYGLYRPRGP